MHGILRYAGYRRTRGRMEDIDILWLGAHTGGGGRSGSEKWLEIER